MDFHWSHRGRDTFETVQEEQYADHSSVEVLLLLNVCLQVVLFDGYDIACSDFGYS